MPRPRPTEVKLVKRLITEEEWESEDELAAAIITKLDEARATRDLYALVVRWGRMLHAYGPFDTAKQAERARLAGMGQPDEDGGTAVVCMTTPAQGWAAIEAAG